jgi:hypothetical protein
MDGDLGRVLGQDGTHQGSVKETHLASYLNEFVFRFNRRRSRSRGRCHLLPRAPAGTRPAWTDPKRIAPGGRPGSITPVKWIPQRA